MLQSKSIIREHPETCEDVELTVEFTYTPEELPSEYNAFGRAEHYEIHNVYDKHNNYYSDELVWTDDQIIEGIKAC